MITTGLALSALALIANAFPTDFDNSTIESRDANTFNINVWNNCNFQKQVGLYQITSSFEMIQKSKPKNVASKKMVQIKAPFYATGMRLSGHAENGTAWQWNAQALFEFGYSTYAGQQGTAYDASVMEGSDKDIGIGIYPIPNGKGSRYCESKTCFPCESPSPPLPSP